MNGLSAGDGPIDLWDVGAGAGKFGLMVDGYHGQSPNLMRGSRTM